MDHQKLHEASKYLNNLLLARGHLRNGEPIDFVKPSRESRADIINLVHDLILRGDRDAEQRETFAHTIRQLSSDDARKAHEIERLTTKSEESARAAAQAQAAERTTHAELKKAEKALKSLQDQTTKLKATLAQVKTQCTNDVRKRDLEVARLKTHLQGQQRGNRVGMAAPSMTVRRTVAESSAHDLRDPEYSLKQESTEFLTQLSQSLSDENDSLISLLRNSLSTVKDLLGLPANAKRYPDSAVGSMDGEEAHGKHKNGDSLLHQLPTSYDTLAGEMGATIEHLKAILTNPNFVSMEEVELREEEIVRLRAGWDRMETRFHDVMHMLQGWLRRMNTGDTINIEDLRQGMGIVSPRREREGEQQTSGDLSIVSEHDDSGLSAIEEVSERMVSPPHRPHFGNSSPKRKRDVLEPPESFDLRPLTATAKEIPPSPPKHATVSSSRTTELLQDDDESEDLEVPQLTIQQKLSAAQAEAEEAVAARAAARQDGSSNSKMPETGLDGSLDELANERDDDTLGKMPSPIKRTKIRGRPRKRKSTLSAEELETLICADEG